MFLKCFGESSSSGRPYPTAIEELCPHFSFAEIRKSTNKFDHKREIGEGGVGKVYKGCLQHIDGSDYAVAVKRFNPNNQSTEEFKREVELLCQLHHPNCVSIVGFCNYKKENIAVYEYMSNGSLDQQLQALPWTKRIEICIGAARGLHYLHSGLKRTIIHGDIKPSTVLLDDNMHPKLSSFGLSILGTHFKEKPKPIQTNIIRGTYGYMPFEYAMEGTVTDKCDAYAFGVVLLDVVRGRRILELDNNNHLSGKEFLEKCVEELIDPKIKGKIAPECWQVFIDIALRCIKNEPDERPSMGEVEVELELALFLQEQADLTNINSDYTLLSKTIINPESDWMWGFHDSD